MLEVKLNPLDTIRLQWDISLENWGLESWLISPLIPLVVICSIFDYGSESIIN